jgi:hypothetical protein
LNNGAAYISYIKQKTIESLDIPLLELKIPEKSWDNIQTYYTKYLKSKDLGFLKKNKWCKAELTFKGQKYNVKIKTHGKTPDGHFNNGVMSLSVKFQKKTALFQKRINLIIYQRILKDNDLLQVLANQLDIHYQPTTLTKVTINNQKMHLFYIDNR